MTHIEQMIKDLCPNGVEFKPLGELGVFENTGVDKKSRDDEQEVTLLNFMDVCRHKYIDASVPTMVVTAPDRKITQCNVLKDDIFITPSSETIDEIGFAAVIMEDLPNVVYSYHIMRYRLNNPDTTTAKFIRYLFEAPVVRKQILKGAKGLTRFGLSKYQFAEIEIPLPPLEIQKKIVECLDKFSALAAELQAELQKRRTQYEYYRTRLLTPPHADSTANSTDDCNWEWKTLGDICEIKNGKDYKHLNDGPYPVYGSGGIMTYKDQYAYDKPSILLPRKGSIGKIHYVDEPFWNVDTAFYTVIDTSQIIPRYLFHYLSTINLEAYNTGTGSIPSLTQTVLKTIPVAFPSLPEQQRIADILDKFEKLITSMEEGIPAEQAAQQKRYEYYRDLLLTFDRKAV